MEFETVFHWFVYEHWRALMVFACLHFPIWMMKGGRWASLWTGDK